MVSGSWEVVVSTGLHTMSRGGVDALGAQRWTVDELMDGSRQPAWFGRTRTSVLLKAGHALWDTRDEGE